jgi:ribosomal protein L11 methyltransferase
MKATTSAVRWWEAVVRVPAELADDAAALAVASGAHGAVEGAAEPGKSILRIAFSGDFAAAEVADMARDALAGLGLERCGVTVHERVEEDWSERWKERFEPLRLGARLWVVPSWHDDFSLPTGALALHLDPGMAFGTGQHETTALCAEWLEAHLDERAGNPPSVLDVGCGSGILAMAAARFGARPVLGIDNDPIAVRVAQENAVANDAPIELSERALVDVQDRFDVVVANILAETLCELAAELVAHVSTGGWLVLSGILATQRAQVESCFVRAVAQADRTVAASTWTQRGIWMAAAMRV